MKRFTILFVLVFAGTATANSYLDNKKTATHDCAKDPDAMIGGNENTVTVDAVDVIVTNGNKNKVTWNKGIADKRPKISNPGNGNKIGGAK